MPMRRSYSDYDLLHRQSGRKLPLKIYLLGLLACFLIILVSLLAI